MRTSQYYKLALPEVEDPADVRDLTDNFETVDTEMQRQKEEDERQAKEDTAIRVALNAHKAAATLDHPDASVTDAKIGNRSIGGVTGLLQTLLTTVGNAIQAAVGGSTWDEAPDTTLKAAKAHADDAVRHLTAVERTRWNNTYTKAETDAKDKIVEDALTVHTEDAAAHLTAAEHEGLNAVLTLLADIDCGTFTGAPVDLMTLHSVMARAHPLLVLDGNSTDGGMDAQTLEEHMRNANAHGNLIVDGNIN